MSERFEPGCRLHNNFKYLVVLSARTTVAAAQFER